MISSPTTLVLGAGASMPFGFPSGAQLRQQLCDAGVLDELTRYGQFHRLEIQNFCQTFLRSGMASIDAFLARSGNLESVSGGRTFSEIGKAAIAYSLISCEREKNLHLFSNEDNWYQYLWQFIGDSLENLENNHLSVVTFNYDRSLEVYLLLAMQNAFGISEASAAKFLKKIPIVHVYGQIGKLACLAERDEECRYYEPSTSPESINIGAKGIKVIGEHREDGPEFAHAQELISKADRICFLGFGFDATNVRRLGIEKILEERSYEREYAGPEVYATTLGMMKAEREKVLRLLQPRVTRPDPHPRYSYNRERLERETQSRILEPSAERNTNYLRHTGVLD